MAMSEPTITPNQTPPLDDSPVQIQLLDVPPMIDLGDVNLEALPEEGESQGHWLALALRLMAIVLIIAALFYSRDGLVILILLFVLVTPFEKIFPRHKGQKIRRPHLGTDMGYALVSPLLGVVAGFIVLIIAILSLAWVPGLLIRPYVSNIPENWMPFVGFILFDFTVYWTHRFYHEIPILWRFHAIHHSTKHLDWASGFRAHPFDGTILAPAFIFLIAAGFSPELTGVLAVAQIILGLFLHANVRWRLPLLHKVLITPEFHHWHHTNERDAIWTNYSTFLPIWDIIFGTYYMPRGRRPMEYGVTEEIPDGIILQLKHPFRGVGNPMRYLRRPFKGMRIIFAFAWQMIRQMYKSARRPRGSKPWTYDMRLRQTDEIHPRTKEHANISKIEIILNE